MAAEIELKLEVDASDLAALRDAGPFALPQRKTRLEATYFDTADRRLWRNGISLRIRNSDTGLIQTLKRPAGGSGLFERAEWELPVAARTPVPDRRMPLDELLGDADLLPVFEVVTQRRVKRLTRGSSKVELAIDVVEIRGDGRSASFCEIEFECLSGSPAALFALARAIGKVIPARIGVMSKAERGFRLLDAAEQEHRAEDIALAPSTDLPTAFGTIAASCLRQYRINESVMLNHRSPAAVHQARVALRRLRAVIRLFRPLLPVKNTEEFNARLRDLGRILGEARDFDVFMARIEPGPLHERLHAMRDKAYAEVEKTLAAPATARLMLHLSEWLAVGAWRHDPATQDIRATPLTAFACQTYDRFRRKLRRHGRHLAALSEDDRHRLRKDMKKLRYAVDFFRCVFPGPGELRRARQFAKALGKLQDQLGALNDHAAASRRIDELGLTGTAEAERVLGKWDTKRLLASAAATRHDILDLEPFWR